MRVVVAAAGVVVIIIDVIVDVDVGPTLSILLLSSIIVAHVAAFFHPT